MAKRTRIVLCVSVFQIITAKAAMIKSENAGDTYSDYILIIHPALTAQTKFFIRQVAGLLAYEAVIDISHEIGSLLDTPRFLGDASNKFTKLLKNKPDVGLWKKMLGSIKAKVDGIVGKNIDEFFIRYLPIRYDKCITENIYPSVPLSAVPEAPVDEMLMARLRPLSVSKQYLLSSVLVKLEEIVPAIYLLLLSRKYLPVCRPFLPLGRNWHRQFCLIPSRNKIPIVDECQKLFDCLRPLAMVNSRMKVVIAGTTIISDKIDSKLGTGITKVQECELYNDLINYIRRHLEVDATEIFYKPHPRCRYDDWVYKKNNLDCQIYSFEDNGLIDIDMRNNSQLVAVYSYASVSIFSAHLYHNTKSYFIDLRDFNLPWWHDEIFHLCRVYGIDSIKLPIR